MWNNDYDSLLLEWANLREEAKLLPFEDALQLVDDWWWHAPIVSPYIHIVDVEEWPNPWELLSEYGFCDLARSLGICYTLLLINHKDLKSLKIVQTDNYILVLVNDGQYILNNEPGNIKMDSADLHIKYSVDSETIKTKIK